MEYEKDEIDAGIEKILAHLNDEDKAHAVEMHKAIIDLTKIFVDANYRIGATEEETVRRIEAALALSLYFYQTYNGYNPLGKETV